MDAEWYRVAFIDNKRLKTRLAAKRHNGTGEELAKSAQKWPVDGIAGRRLETSREGGREQEEGTGV